jgi:hypothetical protein
MMIQPLGMIIATFNFKSDVIPDLWYWYVSS